MIAGWFANVWAKVVTVGAVLLAILAAIGSIYRRGERAGQDNVENKLNKTTAKTQADFDSIDSATPSVDDALGRLRGRSGHPD